MKRKLDKDIASFLDLLEQKSLSLSRTLQLRKEHNKQWKRIRSKGQDIAIEDLVPLTSLMAAQNSISDLSIPISSAPIPIVIHLDGMAGCGKTTALVLIQDLVQGIDLDDLDDAIVLSHPPGADLEDVRRKVLTDTIADYQRAGQVIVCAGLTMDCIHDVATHGFFLQRDNLVDQFQALNTRGLKTVVQYSSELEQLVKSIDPTAMELQILHGVKLRVAFPEHYQRYTSVNQWKKQDALELGYTVGNLDVFRKYIEEVVMNPSKHKLTNLVNRRILPSTLSKRTIVHIAGSPGSGKNYVGERIQKQLSGRKDIAFADTDTLFKIPEYDEVKDEMNRGVAYRERGGKGIFDFINKHTNKHIVLYGLTVYYAWTREEGFENGRPFPILIAPIPEGVGFSGFFIDISLDQLLEQRYNRDVKPIPTKDVLSGKTVLDFSRKDISNYTTMERNQYKTVFKYKFLPQDQIEQRVLKLFEIV